MVVKNVNRDWCLMALVGTRWHSISIRNSWELGGYSVNYCHGVLWIRAHRGHEKESQMTYNEPFGFFVVSHLGLSFISGSAYISVAGLCLHLVLMPWYRRRSACRCERRILRKKHLEKCEIYNLMILPLWDKFLLCERVENRLQNYGDRP